jgi:flagellin-like hook-associated protein FlgL
MASVTTLYHLTNKEGSMNKALERISSGLRLNHAVDDAAGASIVNRMTSQIKGLEAAIRNAADAISLTQTAEGSLEEVTQILHRMRELSVQAANGVYTGQDRQAINNEIVAMQNELQRIAESSTFNGVKMLNGDFQDTTFQVGFQPNDTATLSIEDVRPSGLGEYILSTSNIDANTTASSVSEITNRVTTTVTAAETASLTIQSVITDNDASSAIDASDAVDAKLSSALQAFVDLDKDANGFANGTFAISGTDAASFSVSNTKDATHGVVTGTNIDYETKTSYAFDLVYTNSAGEKFNEAVTVNVTNDTVTEVAEKLTFTLTQPFTDLVDGNRITVTDGVTSLVYTTAAGTKLTDDNTTTTNIVNGLKALPGYAAAGYTLTASGSTIVMDMKAPGAFTQANATITSNGTLLLILKLKRLLV